MDKRSLEKEIVRQQSLKPTAHAYVPREAESHVDLASSAITLVTGVRGCGKTTMCLHMLQQAGASFAYVDVEALVPSALDFASSAVILEVLLKVCGQFTHIFIDELYPFEGWQQAIGILSQRCKVVMATSERSLEDQAALCPDLDVKVVKLMPLSFREYCRWHQVPTDMSTAAGLAAVRNAFDKYLVQGGFPECQDRTRVKSWGQKQLMRILQLDAKGKYRASNVLEIEKVAKHIIEASPRFINYKGILHLFGLKSENTVKKYIEVIKGTRVAYGLKKFALFDKQRNNSEKIFAIDPVLITEGTPEDRLETVVMTELLRSTLDSAYGIHYYSNREASCNFAVCHNMKMIRQIQVIYDYTDAKALKAKVAGLVSLAKSTGCTRLTIITDNESGVIMSQGLEIEVAPAYEIILNNVKAY